MKRHLLLAAGAWVMTAVGAYAAYSKKLIEITVALARSAAEGYTFLMRSVAYSVTRRCTPKLFTRLAKT